VIACVTAFLVVGLFVVGAIAGGGEVHDGNEHPDPLGYSMTSSQYAGVRLGTDEQAFVNRLEQTGLPENLTKDRYIVLFPPHGAGVVCSYWEIADQLDLVARFCFSASQARLVQKLERAAPADSGVSVSA
jgi:hypothetical protein